MLFLWLYTVSANLIWVKLHQLLWYNPTGCHIGGNYQTSVFACVPVCCPSGHSQRLHCRHFRANRKQQRIQRQRRVRLLSWESLLCGRRTRQTGLGHQHEGCLQGDEAGGGGRPVLQRRWQVGACPCVVFTESTRFGTLLSVLLLLLLPRYLCDFAYYCSLYHGDRKAALIHVPSSGSLASADTLVPLLQTLILAMLDQLRGPSDRQSQWAGPSYNDILHQ